MTLLATAALVVAVAVTLAGRQHRSLGGNGVGPGSFVRILAPGARSCEDVPGLPAGAGFVHMVIGTYGPPGPPIRVSFRRGARVVARGRLAAGWKQGDVLVPLSAPALPAGPSAMCLRNDGAGRLALAGSGDRFRVDYLTAANRSWFAWAGLVADRYAQGKSTIFGGWALPATLVLMALAAAIALVATVRGAR